MAFEWSYLKWRDDANARIYLNFGGRVIVYNKPHIHSIIQIKPLVALSWAASFIVPLLSLSAPTDLLLNSMLGYTVAFLLLMQLAYNFRIFFSSEKMPNGLESTFFSNFFYFLCFFDYIAGIFFFLNAACPLFGFMKEIAEGGMFLAIFVFISDPCLSYTHSFKTPLSGGLEKSALFKLIEFLLTVLLFLINDPLVYAVFFTMYALYTVVRALQFIRVKDQLILEQQHANNDVFSNDTLLQPMIIPVFSPVKTPSSQFRPNIDNEISPALTLDSPKLQQLIQIREIVKYTS